MGKNIIGWFTKYSITVEDWQVIKTLKTFKFEYLLIFC